VTSRMRVLLTSVGQIEAVATLGRDPQAVAAMELLRLKAMPSRSVIASSGGDFDLTKHLESVSP
jgi:hypothetical protein